MDLLQSHSELCDLEQQSMKSWTSTQPKAELTVVVVMFLELQSGHSCGYQAPERDLEASTLVA